MKSLTNKLHPRHYKPWTKLESRQFRLLYPKYSTQRLIYEFDRTEPAILSRACNLGLKKDVSKGYQRPPLPNRRRWTDREIEFLRKHHKTMTYTDIADVLERSSIATGQKLLALDLKKVKLYAEGRAAT